MMSSVRLIGQRTAAEGWLVPDHEAGVEPIFEAVLADDPSGITADTAGQRMDQDLFVAELPHQLYLGDTPPRDALAAGRL
jgi:hypothetical protein